MEKPTPCVRAAVPEEQDALALLWFESWQDAHAALAPPEVARHRTLDSFRNRLTGEMESLRVIGSVGDPDGFAWVSGNELYQFFLHARARGSGAAAILLADAERLLAAEAHSGWLVCAIGNDRAARFYAKNGWVRTGVITSQIELPTGLFPLDVWRYEKRFDPAR